MYCTSCGIQRDDNATVCANCGEPIRRLQPQPQIDNYLIPAILTTVFCCLPAGIVAIIYSAQVNSKLATGDIAGAQAASKNAKLWSMISAGLIALLMLVSGAFFVISLAASK